MPSSIGGELFLDGLINIEGLKLPQSYNSISLNGLSTAEGLILPETLRILSLNGLTSAKGVTLPKYIELIIKLQNLTTADGLILPQIRIGAYLLGSLPESERKKLRQRQPEFAQKVGIR